jgi:hypothetical protein
MALESEQFIEERHKACVKIFKRNFLFLCGIFMGIGSGFDTLRLHGEHFIVMGEFKEKLTENCILSFI